MTATAIAATTATGTIVITKKNKLKILGSLNALLILIKALAETEGLFFAALMIIITYY